MLQEGVEGFQNTPPSSWHEVQSSGINSKLTFLKDCFKKDCSLSKDLKKIENCSLFKDYKI